ncbi:MAG: hypothetical protein ACE5JX_22475 [Acidobacteriota bacterium]
MRVVFQQADLDTCLGAAILGIGAEDQILWRRTGATAAELADPSVVCLEAGGSGRTDLNNFDHHDTPQALEPACVQAFEWRGRPSIYARLVDYGRLVDTAGPLPDNGFPSVSHLISGVRFVHAAQPEKQFLESASVLARIAELGLDPFQPLPANREWEPYLLEKRRRMEELPAALAGAELEDHAGLRIAFLATDVIGAPGALYRGGADVAVVFNPRYGIPPLGKFTIGGNGVRVDILLPLLNAVDPGWGGPAHGTIIGSPHAGTSLSFSDLRRIVIENVSLMKRDSNPGSKSVKE